MRTKPGCLEDSLSGRSVPSISVALVGFIRALLIIFTDQVQLGFSIGRLAANVGHVAKTMGAAW
jgi:hypothetical protein